MSSERFWSQVEDLAAEYRHLAEADLADRWGAWKVDLSKAEIYEVIGALLARQVTLATHLVGVPPVWTDDLGPIFLRSMADVHITLAWILADPETRARDFIVWGLGQAKLELEQRKAWAAAKGKEPDELMKGLAEWIDSQQWSFLTEVSLGSWTGKNTRDMAKDVGLEDFYEHVYQPFSAATHSTWRHVQRFNLQPCDRVLHRYHLLPLVPGIDVDPRYPRLAAKYLEKSLLLFDEKVPLSLSAPASRVALESAFEKLVDELRQTQQDATGSTEEPKQS